MPDKATTAAATEAEASATIDRTAAVQAVAADVVTKATETEPGRIEVETPIAAPRSDAGSAQGAERDRALRGRQRAGRRERECPRS